MGWMPPALVQRKAVLLDHPTMTPPLALTPQPYVWPPSEPMSTRPVCAVQRAVRYPTWARKLFTTTTDPSALTPPAYELSSPGSIPSATAPPAAVQRHALPTWPDAPNAEPTMTEPSLLRAIAVEISRPTTVPRD